MLIDMTLSLLAEICGGQLMADDLLFTDVVTDTRKVAKGALFVAIKGERFDGHDFAQDAINQGAVAVLSDRDLPNLPYVKVANTVDAYGRVARHIRDTFHGSIISITGSNGKTTVKDWLAQSFTGKSVLKTRANLNNQIGVPQTLLELMPQHDVAVIEAGTSFPGEIKKLSYSIYADVVILTNASGSHFEGFGSLEGIAIEKGELITGAKETATVILNADDGFFDYWYGLAAGRQVMSFGFSPKAQLYAKDIQLNAQSSRAVFCYQGQEVNVEIGCAGKHQIANGMAVVLALMVTGVLFVDAVKVLRVPVQVKGRLERLATKNNALLINDCYNASPKSVEAAIDVLTMQPVEKTWLVLGALGELGSQRDEIHASLGRYANAKNVSCLVSVGPIAAIAAEAFKAAGGEVVMCQDHSEAAAVIQPLNEAHAILIKGSRSSQMENVIDIIMN
ncbi:UDP-N-acetylmuramoyl-tripeptide--D-alanyl-D-alanine ligase [Marinomonas spartinae]|uniref:UDP-N-acetylmuramoyl-tripeptide--D-alanyl-D- alanine ligase n=1 Tax=Marinomonas spartinae TaxID=1792290 RepID=UPI000808BFB6|nr:UDP-N-acetylmuramoyl-tripeptide--D-alanyl-D-alanine ligase [Marinomonas spartinae]SBS36987.1 UDP-N-acetylmuramoyl-tripeptide--D-alanyl-D-alanine ligase [Marinomonas spartinae]